MELERLIAAVTACLVAVTGLVGAVAVLWKKLGLVKGEFDEFLAAHMLRGKAEAMRKDLVVETYSSDSPEDEGWHMPVAVRQRAAKLYAPVEPVLRGMRLAHPDDSETEMAKRIERRLGGWIARHVCVPLGVNQFACLVMAVSIADGIPVVPESVHE